jgi:hypothetical protein
MAKDPMMIPAAAEAYVARLSGDAATYAEDAIEMLKSAVSIFPNMYCCM